MAALTTALGVVACIAAAVALERAVQQGLRAAWLAHEPLSGEHTDSVVYHRSLWTPGEADLLGVAGLLALSGALAAASLFGGTGSLWLALPAWLAALALDLARWQRVAASVKFVSWRRGWRRSARRIAVSDLREVSVVERSAFGSRWPALARPRVGYVALLLRNGKAVKLPRNGALFGGDTEVERLANFVRLQMDMVADNRRRAAADKRAALRRAMQPMAPAHPATKLDGSALPPLTLG